MQRRRYNPENEVQNPGPCVMENNLFTPEGDVNYPFLSGKIIHYELYATDGYINSGVNGDPTNIAGWPAPVYIWGFTDHDPNVVANQMKVPAGALATQGTPVGNAKFPAPFLECKMGEHVFITVHNRGFLQNKQTVQDDHSLHLHGIHAQTVYDGFPETAGGYRENLRYFWLENWYTALGATPEARDAVWNRMTPRDQFCKLNDPKNTPLIKPNQLNDAGGIFNFRNTDPYPDGPNGTLPYGNKEDWTQFTYYFTPTHLGTFMYHCHVSAAEHVQMGMYGALVVRPADGSRTVFGRNTHTDYDVEYTFLLSEFDTDWHLNIESGTAVSFDPSMWRPQLWFVNGRTFPQCAFKFAWNTPTGPEYESRYNSYVRLKPGQIRFLARYINMGYQEHPMHQHGWHMNIVGKDGMPVSPQHMVFTQLIGSGETYDAITTAVPIYGITGPSGSPLSKPLPPPNGPNTLKWRAVYPIHDHDDYRVTTAGTYPGGALILIEACGVSGTPGGKPTWFDPYTPPNGAIETLPSHCADP